MIRDVARRNGRRGYGPAMLHEVRGMVRDRSSREPVYPRTRGEFLDRTAISVDSLYLFDEASGNLLDKAGSVPLTVNSTPAFGSSLAGRRAILYDSALDRHGDDGVHLPSGSVVAGGVMELTAVGLTSGFLGCLTTIADPGWGLYFQTTGIPSLLVRDSGAASLVITASGVTPSVYPGPWFYTIQIDRTNAIARCRISWNRRAIVVMAGSLAGFGSLIGGTQKTAFGAGNAMSHNGRISYGFIASGAQCEGANVLANLARALGHE